MVSWLRRLDKLSNRLLSLSLRSRKSGGGVRLTAALFGGVGAGFVLGIHYADYLLHASDDQRFWLPWREMLASSSAPDSSQMVPFDAVDLPRPGAAGPTPIKSRASEIMQFGYPGFDNLRTFEDFVLSYDRRNRTAHWVYEHLTPDRMVYDKSVDRSKCNFTTDDSVHAFFRSQNDDYKGSGYDRGHLAAAGNHRRSQNAISQTFLLSNMSPQVGKGFNRDKWNELEKRCRAMARRCPNVFICTGPLYLPRQEPDGQLYVKYRVIGRNHVSVPTHFFKVLLMQVEPNGPYDMEAYVLPNQPIADATPLQSFQVPLESIERAAGFLIFDQLPKNKLRLVNGARAK